MPAFDDWPRKWPRRIRARPGRRLVVSPGRACLAAIDSLPLPKRHRSTNRLAAAPLAGPPGVSAWVSAWQPPACTVPLRGVGMGGAAAAWGAVVARAPLRRMRPRACPWSGISFFWSHALAEVTQATGTAVGPGRLARPPAAGGGRMPPVHAQAMAQSLFGAPALPAQRPDGPARLHHCGDPRTFTVVPLEPARATSPRPGPPSTNAADLGGPFHAPGRACRLSHDREYLPPRPGCLHPGPA